jgi:protein TonB
MRWWALSGYGLSLLIHFGFAAGLSVIPKETRRRPTVVTVFEAKPKKEKPKEPEKEEKPPEPPKPIAVPKQVLTKPAEPPPAEAPPPSSPTPAGHPAMTALPDFGISLGGSVGGGIAIPSGGGGRGEGRAGALGAGAEKRARAPAAQPAGSAEAPCTEEPTKAAFRERVAPQYTDDARSANIEGRVRVEVTINAEGDVIASRVIEGLGHGLDESALVAVKRTKFRPITRCGKSIAAPKPFVVPYRFNLSD